MNNSSVAHAWAHGRRGSAGNFTTDGTSLWSYSTLIGQRREVNGHTVFFLNPTYYSPTTQRHQSYAARAVYGDNIVHAIAHDPMPELLAATLAAQDALAQRKPGSKVHAYAQDTLARAITNVEQWCALADLPVPDLADLRAQATAKAEEGKAIRAAEDARRLAQQKVNLVLWRAFEPMGEGGLPSGTWLRVKDDVVHTSGGLKFPLQACRDKLAAGVKVGDDVFGFRCLEVTAKRYVVGCHIMDRKHVEEVLGVKETANG